MKMNTIDTVAYVLVVIGGINWGFVGWLDYNLVDSLLGAGSAASRVVYALVGVAALYMIYEFVKLSKAKTTKNS